MPVTLVDVFCPKCHRPLHVKAVNINIGEVCRCSSCQTPFKFTPAHIFSALRAVQKRSEELAIARKDSEVGLGRLHFRNKCKECGLWTVFQVMPKGFRATITCTVCGHSFHCSWDREVREGIRKHESHLRTKEDEFPALTLLRKSGVAVNLPLPRFEICPAVL